MILNGTAFWIMVAMFGIVFLMMAVESKVYEKMLDQTQNLQHTGVQILKQIKMKYEGLCRVGRNVNNTRNFVDKLMLSWKICGIRARVFGRVEKVLTIGCAYIGLILFMYTYFKHGWNRQCLIYLGGGALMWMALKIWEITLDVSEKREQMLVMITDYLENQMYPNLSIVAAAKNEAAMASDVKEEKKKDKEMSTRSEKEKKRKNDYEEQLIKEVLEEYL